MAGVLNTTAAVLSSTAGVLCPMKERRLTASMRQKQWARLQKQGSPIQSVRRWRHQLQVSLDTLQQLRQWQQL